MSLEKPSGLEKQEEIVDFTEAYQAFESMRTENRQLALQQLREALESHAKASMIRFTVDWKDRYTPINIKDHFIEDRQRPPNQKREAYVRCTPEQRISQINAFASGVRWIDTTKKEG